ncbi:hypothetical protein F2Q69_00029879 [Brassica cretica]|uniref:Uncharacterized protein n=1 Tax=Brassica cretica TaxID=69181 RepID=A0A8S9S2V4_BRACR|nr:hypothetical protein F2Q69_00029879 [Brassica cretica]
MNPNPDRENHPDREPSRSKLLRVPISSSSWRSQLGQLTFWISASACSRPDLSKNSSRPSLVR